MRAMSYGEARQIANLTITQGPDGLPSRANMDRAYEVLTEREMIGRQVLDELSSLVRRFGHHLALAREGARP